MNRKQLTLAVWLTALAAWGTGATVTQGADDSATTKQSMTSRFAQDLDPDNPWPEYPRPRIVRDHWLNLNGKWDYAIRPKEESKPTEWDGKIVVPFCVESQLSGVQKTVGEANRLWYRRTFKLPKEQFDQRLLLHFGAVDWQTTVWVNGQELIEHRGGYDPFTVEITDSVKRDAENELVVAVWDPTDAASQPRGKQVRKPGGIMYTAVTGIWQTVWIEPVPKGHIADVSITPNLDENQFVVTVLRGNETKRESAAGRQSKVKITLSDNGEAVSSALGKTGEKIIVKVPSPKTWSPQSPFLYDVQVDMTDDTGALEDSVRSYAGLRKIHFQKDERGVNRMYLNNEPLFQFGPLDQGWWPDGLYTAPTDEALRYDIEATLDMGFNMARKHVKVEPARWYYWADKLGLLVWQDMPSGAVAGWSQIVLRGQPDVELPEEVSANFKNELKAMLDELRDHPSIVVWVPFNEGWGQHKTNEILKWVKDYDPTRLVGGPSGWEDRDFGDLKDLHQYPGPGMFPVIDDRVSVLGEFGGLGLPLEGHTWLDRDNWGYRTYQTTEELRTEYEKLIEQLPPLIADGLAAAVYTQTTDVEVEVNGLLTYDRKVNKFDPARLREIHAQVYAPPGKRTVLVPSSQQTGQVWQYTFENPGDGWEAADFDASGWSSGEGGFGTKETPNTNVRTTWNTPDIWIRREFNVDEIPNTPLRVRVHHDDDVKIYLNGELIVDKERYERGYNTIPVQAKLKQGRNVITAHCHQREGGQFIDIGLETFEPGVE